MSKKVSIIIPIFNSFNYIEHTLNSVKNQTYENLEIIIVDDGSTDGSSKIVRSFKDTRIIYIQQDNKGAANARNRGLKKATGDYIQYLDSDDILHPRKIQKQIIQLSRIPKGAVACGPWAKFTDSLGKAKIKADMVWKDYHDPVEWLIDSWLGAGIMLLPCWLIPKNIADKAGPWNEKFSLHDDGEYFTRILLYAQSIKFIDEAITYYRQVPGSLSRIRNSKAIESAYQVTDLSVQHLLKRSYSPLAKKACARHYGRFAYEFYSINKDLANEALDKMEQLASSRYLKIGPPKFNALVQVLGLRKALQIKNQLIS